MKLSPSLGEDIEGAIATERATSGSTKSGIKDFVNSNNHKALVVTGYGHYGVLTS